MYRLFSKIPKGLDPVSSMFKQVGYILDATVFYFIFLFFIISFQSHFLCICILQHVTAEGTTLVKQAEDAASNKKVCTYLIENVLKHTDGFFSSDQCIQNIKLLCTSLQAEKRDVVGLQEQVAMITWN